MAVQKWFAWSRDDRTGAWMVVNEGLRKHVEEYVERMIRAGVKAGINVQAVALPEGETPQA